MSTIIEPITSRDLDAVLDLNEASVPHLSRINREELLWFCEQAASTLLARIDGQFAGFLIGLRPGSDYASPNYRWFSEHYDDFAYVDRVAVVAWARRRGIADTLYDHFANAHADAPVMTCEVNVRPSNLDSMRFHENKGFRIVDHQETEGGKKKVALMEKTL